MKVIQIVPDLPPGINGVGDYGERLAIALRENHGVDTHFLACNTTSDIPANINGFSVFVLEQRTAESLRDALTYCAIDTCGRDVPLIVHFAPYAYQQRGVPLWLVKGLEKWSKNRNTIVATMFHELETTGSSWWSSSRWVPPFQRSIIARLIRQSTAILTNTAVHQERLASWGGGTVSFVPNFSNIAEPKENIPTGNRDRQVVVFGRPWQRRLVYEFGHEELKRTCAILGANRIIDIGDPIVGGIDFNAVKVLECGRLSAQSVAEWLGSSIGLFLWYPITSLTKSSVYASGCASGIIPFVADHSGNDPSCIGLIAGEDFVHVTKNSGEFSNEALQKMSSVVYANYQNRSSSNAAQMFFDAVSAKLI